MRIGRRGRAEIRLNEDAGVSLVCHSMAISSMVRPYAVRLFHPLLHANRIEKPSRNLLDITRTETRAKTRSTSQKKGASGEAPL
jgi:hypothetical protein